MSIFVTKPIVYLSADGSATALVNNTYNSGGNAGVLLTPGTYLLNASAAIVPTGLSALVEKSLGIATSSGGAPIGKAYTQERPASHTPSGNMRMWHKGEYLVVTANQTYYPTFLIGATVGTATVSCYIEAIKIIHPALG